MKYTCVLHLGSIASVKELFKCLLEMKRLAPASLSYTVAITATRNSTVRELKNGSTKAEEFVKGSLNKLERRLSG